MAQDALAPSPEILHADLAAVRLPDDRLIRYAVWSDDTPSPSPWRAFAKEFSELPLALTACTAFVWLCTCAISCIDSQDPNAYAALPLMEFFGAAYVAALYLLVGQGLTMEECRTARIREQLARVDDGCLWNEVPVTIQIFSKGACLGRDFGHLSAVDGYLYYSGIRTSFSFAPSKSKRLLGFGPRIRLAYSRDGQSYQLRIRSISDQPGDSLRRIRHLWTETPRHSGPGVQVLPPTDFATGAISAMVAAWTSEWAVPLLLPVAPVLFLLGVWLDSFLIWPTTYGAAGFTLAALPLAPALLLLCVRVFRLRCAGLKT